MNLELFSVKTCESFGLGQGDQLTWLKTEFKKRRSFPILFKYIIGIEWGSTPGFFSQPYYGQLIEQNTAQLQFMDFVTHVIVSTLPLEKWNDPAWLSDSKIRRMADICYELRFILPLSWPERFERGRKRFVSEIGYSEKEANAVYRWWIVSGLPYATDYKQPSFDMPAEAMIQRYETGLREPVEKEPTYEPEPEPEPEPEFIQEPSVLPVEPEPEFIQEPPVLPVEPDIYEQILEPVETEPDILNLDIEPDGVTVFDVPMGPIPETTPVVTEAVSVPLVDQAKNILSTTQGKVLAGLSLLLLLRSLK